MFSNQAFVEKYNPEIHEFKVGGRVFQYYLPKSIDRFIDFENPMKSFPLWAKVWPSSMVLADYLVSEPVNGERKTLEIGSGIGIVGIAASAFGHDVVVSEYNADALEFAKANARINGCADTSVISLDWNSPGSAGRFDRIVGSEVVFRKEDIFPLKNLFQSVLKPGGEVLLVSEIRRPLIEFVRNTNDLFDIKAQQRTLRAETEEIKIVFCRMTGL